ncbi:hypothetical protein diail_2831 [Diaporthe ilicicola]|nr:hypothetical protein diail_2831 [Diaporthe ilicicola]
MAPIPPPSNLPPSTTTEPITVHRLTSYTTTPFATMIRRFRALVPQVDLSNLRSQTSAEGVREVIESTLKQSDVHFGEYQKRFVLFYELNHSHWIRHFHTAADSSEDPPGQTVLGQERGLVRFIFGNPLIAVDILKEDVEAGLHVPVECIFVETGEKNARGTKMVVMMPGGLIDRNRNEETSEMEAGTLRLNVAELEAKILKLVEELMR